MTVQLNHRAPLQRASQELVGNRVLIVKSGSDANEDLKEMCLESAAAQAVREGTQEARDLLADLDSQLDRALQGEGCLIVTQSSIVGCAWGMQATRLLGLTLARFWKLL